jgi:hypothetical protein
MHSPPATGIVDDTFLHLFDGWVMWAMDEMTPRQVDLHTEAFDAFTEHFGDRFADAGDLEDAIDRWAASHQGDTDKKVERARKVLDDILEWWRAVEE